MKLTIGMPMIAGLAAIATPVSAATPISTPAPTSPTTFNFTSGSNPSSWAKDGITLSVSGWSTSSTAPTATPTAGTATAYQGHGYGVINSATDDSHTIDNSGWYDFVRLDFNKLVTLDTISLAQFGDTDAWVSFGSKATDMTSVAGWGSFLDNGSNYFGNNVDRTFSVDKATAASVWLIGAARGTNIVDSFKLSGVTVTAPVASAVPEPATWAMMLVGFGGIGAAMRRRKSKVATAVRFA